MPAQQAGREPRTIDGDRDGLPADLLDAEGLGADGPDATQPPPHEEVPLAELTEQALAADPEPVLGPDAVSVLAGPGSAELLPSWYMPAPASGVRAPRGARSVIAVIIAAFLVINALGLCITYGVLTIA